MLVGAGWRGMASTLSHLHDSASSNVISALQVLPPALHFNLLRTSTVAQRSTAETKTEKKCFAVALTEAAIRRIPFGRDNTCLDKMMKSLGVSHHYVTKWRPPPAIIACPRRTQPSHSCTSLTPATPELGEADRNTRVESGHLIERIRGTD